MKDRVINKLNKRFNICYKYKELLIRQLSISNGVGHGSLSEQNTCPLGPSEVRNHQIPFQMKKMISQIVLFG